MGRTGPKNLGRMGTGLKARGARVKVSKARTPRVNAALAAPRGRRVTPPGGGGAGSPRATTSMASMTGQKKINKPKTPANRTRSGRLGKPRADFPSKI